MLTIWKAQDEQILFRPAETLGFDEIYVVTSVRGLDNDFGASRTEMRGASSQFYVIGVVAQIAKHSSLVAVG